MFSRDCNHVLGKLETIWASQKYTGILEELIFTIKMTEYPGHSMDIHTARTSMRITFIPLHIVDFRSTFKTFSVRTCKEPRKRRD